MRQAGYVHRDISLGNCLLYREANGNISLKLSDLKWAKPYEQVSLYEQRVVGAFALHPVDTCH